VGSETISTFSTCSDRNRSQLAAHTTIPPATWDDRHRQAEEIEHIRPDEERRDEQDEGVDRDLARELRADLAAHVCGQRKEHRGAAERIDDRQQCRDDEQHTFDDETKIPCHVRVRCGDTVASSRCGLALHYHARHSRTPIPRSTALAPTRTIYGFHAVTARLRQRPDSLRAIYLSATRHDARTRGLIARAGSGPLPGASRR
jgi:hypothetical protein